MGGADRWPEVSGRGVAVVVSLPAPSAFGLSGAPESAGGSSARSAGAWAPPVDTPSCEVGSWDAAAGAGAARRCQRAERALHLAQALAILAAPVAVAKVAAGPPVGAHAAAVREGQVGPDLGARGVPRLGGLHQAQPGPDEQGLDRRD